MKEPTDSNVPQIRFKGFAGEWEEKILGELCLTTIGSFVIKTKQNPRGAYPVFNGGKSYTGMYDSFNNEGNKIVISARGANAGFVNIVRKRYWAGNSCYSVSLNAKRHSLDFFYSFIKLNEDRFLENRQSANIPSVSKKDVESFQITLPASAEQTQIGGYFREVDRLIGLQQRKHDKLVTLKKAMLHAMFPQPGTTTPEIRFKGFSGDWVEKKLGEVAAFINGRAYSQPELLDKGKYRVLRVGNFYTNSSWYYSDMELAEKYYADTGDLLYTWSASFGPHIWEGEKVIYHYHIWKVELTEQLRKEFVLQLLENDRKRILETSSGSTMIHITKEGMEKKSVLIPHPDEQQKVGHYFRTLDSLISQHAIQLQKLKQLKSACLEKMFV